MLLNSTDVSLVWEMSESIYVISYSYFYSKVTLMVGLSTSSVKESNGIPAVNCCSTG